MQVAQYIFQSPSPNPVQVGRLDPSSVKEQSSGGSSSSLPKAVVSQTETKAEMFASSEVKEVRPSVSATSIDLYA